jgi:hypothetical protein
MLLVLLSWCYLFFTAYNLGFAANKTVRLKCDNFVVIAFLGLITVTVIASIWAVFGRINIEFHCFLLLCNLISFFTYRIPIVNAYRLFTIEISAVPKASKWYLSVILLLLLMQSAAASHSIDNETYYIQTIKWLNEYGFVKGLANLHIFLAQTSGWHVLQSAFDFSFGYANFNDLNGFCLLLGNIFVLQKRYEQQNSIALLAFFPLANLILFPFVSAPSPDLAVCVIGFIVFIYFLESFDDCTPQSFSLIFILSAFLIFVKITAWPILLLPAFLLFLNFRKVARHISVAYIFGIIILSLLVAKNTILTGYPFFPSALLSDTVAFDFKLPAAVYDFWFNKPKLYDFVVAPTAFRHLGAASIFIKWLFYSGIDSFFNGMIIILLLVIPFVIWHNYNYKKYWILYSVMVAEVIFMFLTSPQFRFVLHFILFFALLMASIFVANKRWIAALSYASLIGILIMILFPINTQSYIFANNRFSVKNIMIPFQNSNLKTIPHIEKIGNLQYTSPDNKTFIWATGNDDLPCVNQKQLQLLEHKTGYIPQQRATNLSDGFRSAKTSKK